MSKRRYLKLTRRRGDKVALVAIAFLLVFQLIQVVYSIVNDCYINECYSKSHFPFRESLTAVLFYAIAFLIAYGGLIFYFARDKEVFPTWPRFFSKNRVVAACFSVVYLAALLLFFILSLFISPSIWGDDYSALDEIRVGALITCLVGIPVDIIGLYIWSVNFGISTQEPREDSRSLCNKLMTRLKTIVPRP